LAKLRALVIPILASVVAVARRQGPGRAVRFCDFFWNACGT